MGVGPKAKIKAVVSSDLHGPPLIGFRDLRELGVELQFPDKTRIFEPRSGNAINRVDVSGEPFRMRMISRWIADYVATVRGYFEARRQVKVMESEEV